MMPQEEISSAQHQQANPGYGRYEGSHTSSTRQQYETSYEQDSREDPSGKIYPHPRDNTKILQFALPIIALAFLLLFGLLFVVIVGGTAGWISFAAACFVIVCILAYSWAMQAERK